MLLIIISKQIEIKFESKVQAGNMPKKTKVKLKHQAIMNDENILERLRRYVARSKRAQNKRIQDAIARVKK